MLAIVSGPQFQPEILRRVTGSEGHPQHLNKTRWHRQEHERRVRSIRWRNRQLDGPGGES